MSCTRSGYPADMIMAQIAAPAAALGATTFLLTHVNLRTLWESLTYLKMPAWLASC